MEFKDNPHEVVATVEVKSLISRLALKDNLIITVISGRDINDLFEFFAGMDIEKINWVGTHGMDIKYKDSKTLKGNGFKDSLSYIADLKNKISKIIKDTPCFYLEDKKKALALHYRKCNNDELFHLKEVALVVEDFIKQKPLDCLKMNKIIEVKPKNINKGKAFKTIKKKYTSLKPSIDICIGDDVTDNYLFKENKNGINIKVRTDNPEIIETEYFLKNVDDVLDFLNFILNKI
jgi:trehalose 6-phosphate synthase/phosphatase